jgi:hypothetical protein
MSDYPGTTKQKIEERGLKDTPPAEQNIGSQPVLITRIKNNSDYAKLGQIINIHMKDDVTGPARFGDLIDKEIELHGEEKQAYELLQNKSDIERTVEEIREIKTLLDLTQRSDRSQGDRQLNFYNAKDSIASLSERGVALPESLHLVSLENPETLALASEEIQVVIQSYRNQLEVINTELDEFPEPMREKAEAAFTCEQLADEPDRGGRRQDTIPMVSVYRDQPGIYSAANDALVSEDDMRQSKNSVIVKMYITPEMHDLIKEKLEIRSPKLNAFVNLENVRSTASPMVPKGSSEELLEEAQKKLGNGRSI